MAGEIVHVEFPSEDADRAQQFWNGLFGWNFEDSGMPGMDIEASSAKVRELGGDAESKAPVPGHG